MGIMPPSFTHASLLPHPTHCSLSLAHMVELGSRRRVRVPIVSAAGAHVSDLSLDLRFFHSRSPGEKSTCWLGWEGARAGATGCQLGAPG